jgi:hypothetical protein
MLGGGIAQFDPGSPGAANKASKALRVNPALIFGPTLTDSRLMLLVMTGAGRAHLRPAPDEIHQLRAGDSGHQPLDITMTTLVRQIEPSQSQLPKIGLAPTSPRCKNFDTHD